MALRLKCTCSECLTTHRRLMEFGEENIKCPACGHSMKNLPEGELNELDIAVRKQRTNGIIALIGFALAVIFFFCWIFAAPAAVNHLPKTAANEEFMQATGWMGFTIIFLLVSLVFGVLGSLKRYIVEF